MALIPAHFKEPRARGALLGLGLFGASLLYGDGIITPAITVLGAIEGLDIATPLFSPYLVPIALVFMTGSHWGTPPPLLHNLQHNKVVHEQVVVLTILTAEVPHVPEAERAQVERLAGGFYRIVLHYGFMDDPNVPTALQALPPEHGLRIEMRETAFFLGRETLLATNRPGMALWREKLFAAMSRNASRATAFFRLPADRVVEIGMHVEI